MKINLFILDNFSHVDLVCFLMSIEKIEFVFRNISFLNNFKNEDNLILVPPKIKKKSLKESIKTIKLLNFLNTCYLIPIIFEKEIRGNHALSINYPIKINIFEEQLVNLFSKNKYLYKNYILLNNNFLINNLNNKQVYLTEIESKIIKLLFTKEHVLKQTINSDVLNQRPGVESKSLESHLYRLRKKMLNLGGQVIADGEKNIKIK